MDRIQNGFLERSPGPGRDLLQFFDGRVVQKIEREFAAGHEWFVVEVYLGLSGRRGGGSLRDGGKSCGGGTRAGKRPSSRPRAAFLLLEARFEPFDHLVLGCATKPELGGVPAFRRAATARS